MYLIDEKRDVNQASSVLRAFWMKRSRGENKKKIAFVMKIVFANGVSDNTLLGRMCFKSFYKFNHEKTKT